MKMNKILGAKYPEFVIVHQNGNASARFELVTNREFSNKLVSKNMQLNTFRESGSGKNKDRKLKESEFVGVIMPFNDEQFVRPNKLLRVLHNIE